MSKDSFSKVKFYERQLVINKDVQWAIICYSVILSLAVLSGYHLIQTFSQENPDSPSSLIYIFVFIFFTAIICYGLYFTNRIAGPLYRLKVQMENLIAGKDVGELEFRKNDYFKELADLFNQIVKKTKN
ncbi:MAG: hypothetical protein JNM24_17045 [Bdellovibrionaceae bacterium]|nr:hypothetical protein [Pseudobdellovibrionaceae bacterium]